VISLLNEVGAVGRERNPDIAVELDIHQHFRRMDDLLPRRSLP
jgi:hypothetical protein